MKLSIMISFIFLLSCVSNQLVDDRYNFSIMEANGIEVVLTQVDDDLFEFTIKNLRSSSEKISIRKVNYFTIYLRKDNREIFHKQKIDYVEKHGLLTLLPNKEYKLNFSLKGIDLKGEKDFTLLLKPNFLGKKYKNCVPSIRIKKE